MWIRTPIGLAMAASLLIFLLAASPAAADLPPDLLPGGGGGGSSLDLNEMAAALALPVITGGQAPNTLKASQGDLVVATAGSRTPSTAC